ncbi:MAG TPA: hypothetical protein VL523_10825 [Terriglobia bacterium]|nr:hypothetical protein [Terriglobia bacterium]
MKKSTTILAGFTALAGMICGGIVAPAPARAAAPDFALAGPAQDAAAPKQPQWKSREEYDAFQPILAAKDPNAMIKAAEAFVQKYPSSDFKSGAYVAEMTAYQQLGNSAKAIDAAKQAVAASPDNVEAVSYLSFAFPFVFDPKSADASAQLDQAESNAKHGLDLIGKLQKPAQASDAQFAEYVKAKRAIFNQALGFAALQKKDYPTAITDFNTAKQDNPSDPYVFYRLGLAYLNSTPPDYDHAIWNLARAASLAKAGKAGDAAAIEKYYEQVYSSRHGSDAGQGDVETQAAASVEPPADFKVAQAPKHAATGNQFIDAFYNYEDNLKVGGDTETQTWAQIKGQPFGGPGVVDSVEKGTDPGTFLVRVDITDESKAKDGVYDVELQDNQPGCKDLAKGDLLVFKGTISAYTNTPSFVLTLSGGSIDQQYLDAAADKRKAEKPKPHAPVRRRPHAAAAH